MRNKVLLTMVLLVSAAWAVAQQDSSQQSAPPSSSTPSTQSSPSTSSPSSTTPDAQSGAQNPSSQNPSSQNPSSMPSSSMGSQAAAAGNSIEGCLGGSAGKFTISDKAGMTYDLVLPQGADTSKLGQHVGQEVAVTGTMSNPGAAGSPSDTSASSAGAGATSGGHPSIQVTKIDKVADTCSTNSGAKPPSQ